MANNVYVTGHHRAGTHSFAEKKSSDTSLLYIEEGRIGFNDMNVVAKLQEGKLPTDNKNGGKDFIPDARLNNGFVLQCPYLAHEVQKLALEGTVYWCVRDFYKTLYALKLMNFGYSAWEVVKGFYKVFPDDPIWAKITYDGRDDILCNFVGYFIIMLKVKEYFYDKYFKSITTLVKLEEQTYYDSKQPVVTFKKHETKSIDKHLNEWEKIK